MPLKYTIVYKVHRSRGTRYTTIGSSIYRGACTAGVTTRTTGGNAVGASCAFPFTYKEVSYSKCIDTDNNGVLWCYTDGGLWGNCVLGSGACPLPFYPSTSSLPPLRRDPPSLSSE